MKITIEITLDEITQMVKEKFNISSDIDIKILGQVDDDEEYDWNPLPIGINVLRQIVKTNTHGL